MSPSANRFRCLNFALWRHGVCIIKLFNMEELVHCLRRNFEILLDISQASPYDCLWKSRLISGASHSRIRCQYLKEKMPLLNKLIIVNFASNPVFWNIITDLIVEEYNERSFNMNSFRNSGQYVLGLRS